MARPHRAREQDRRRRIGGWQAMRRLHGDGAGRGDGGRKEHGTSAHRRSEVVVGFVLDLQVVVHRHGTWLIHPLPCQSTSTNPKQK